MKLDLFLEAQKPFKKEKDKMGRGQEAPGGHFLGLQSPPSPPEVPSMHWHKLLANWRQHLCTLFGGTEFHLEMHILQQLHIGVIASNFQTV